MKIILDKIEQSKDFSSLDSIIYLGLSVKLKSSKLGSMPLSVLKIDC